ncbi:MAG: hypothetical protein ACI3ZQ_08405 [Candidatus Cryptobacteroides sp.]
MCKKQNRIIWAVSIAVICFILFPIVLNWLILRPAIVDVVGEGSDWLGFWAAYIGAIASFAMVVLTWWTLKQSKEQNDALIAQNEKILQNNKEQLDELKRQWDAERNPNLLLSIGVAKNAFFLKITNVGLSAAYDIKLSVNEEFLNTIPSKEAKNCFTPLVNPFFIDGKSTKYVYIGQGKEIVETFKDKHIVLKVSGTYCTDGIIDFSCNMDEVVSQKFARIVDDMTDAIEGIEKCISSANSAGHKYNTIQQSLELIAKSLEKISKSTSLEEKKKDNPLTE